MGVGWSSFGEFIFPNAVAFARKTRMIYNTLGFGNHLLSELNANHGSRESSVCSWTWCKLRQKEKPPHCLQEIGIHVMPSVQASCSEHVNWPSLLEAYAIGPRCFKGFGGCGMLHFFCATPLLQVAVATNPTHYGNPETGCESDEQAVRVQGLSGDFCSPKCNSQGSCPSDVPKGDSATPQCALRTTTGDKYCALICQSDSDCGNWAAFLWVELRWNVGGALLCIVVCSCGSFMTQDFVWFRLRSVEIGVTKVFLDSHGDLGDDFIRACKYMLNLRVNWSSL